MSDTTALGLSEAARHLGISVRALRRAIRTGTLPAVPGMTATTHLPAGWLQSAQAAAEASPKVLGTAALQRVPPFARYEGTSAWRKYRARVREFASFKASAT